MGPERSGFAVPPKDFLVLWWADLVFRKSCLVNELGIRLSAWSTRISCDESARSHLS
jgi:hypothetical protein